MARVLLATNDSTLIDILDAEMSGEGHDVLWATDGQAAYARAVAEMPNLVLADVALPVFNGFELCAMLTADPDVPARLPIHLLSDDAVEPHLRERVGAAGVFPKSHQAHQLRELLASVTRDMPSEE